MNALILLTLAIFYIASVLYQFKKLQPFFNRFDKFNLLPNYSFFAPRPLTNDFRLVYKINKKDTMNSNWKELKMYKSFSIGRLLWNPFKYYNKGMIDTCQFLISESNSQENKDRIKISLNHINIVLSIFRFLKEEGKEINDLKFAIISSEGINDIKVKHILFESNYQNI